MRSAYKQGPQNTKNELWAKIQHAGETNENNLI